MATYFPNSDNQRDATQMLYLGEPLPNSYSEAPTLTNTIMMYTNYPSSGSYSDNTLAGNTQQQNNYINIPSDTAPPQQEILSQGMDQSFSTWRDRNEMLFMQPMGGGGGADGGNGGGVFQGGPNLQGQGLSLSLSTEIPSQIQIPNIQYQNPNTGFSSFLGSDPSGLGEGGGRNGSFREDANSQSKQSVNAEYMPLGFNGGDLESIKMDMSPFGASSSIARSVPNSKYLKAAQQLLDEVVNIQKALKRNDTKKELDGGSKNENALPSGTSASSNPQETTNNSALELSAAEKHELQNKMTKLLTMLDEVDRRYKQYYNQMQIVVSSFDVVAGRGAAKPYTALALQTISRHFRSLRDAITGQIQATKRSLGEQDSSVNGKGIGISRLRYVDQQLRQQRAFQQLGMMQQHAWRPQRGLPETSVTILRAWLFEHFLHPYPKDSEKIMLARQTGLTRSQVSNWFINARVRLWKPMVEEMYKEENGDLEMHSNSSSEIAGKATKSDFKTFEEKAEDLQQSATSMSTEHCSTGQLLSSKTDHVPNAEMFGISATTSFRSGTPGETKADYGIVKSRVPQHPGMDDSLFPDSIVQHGNESERFMAYHMSELGRFGSGNGVSLTLGLQQCEGSTLPLSVGTHQSFVTSRGDVIYDTVASSVGPDTADFDCMDSNRQRRFGSSHLLHDFVA